MELKTKNIKKCLIIQGKKGMFDYKVHYKLKCKPHEKLPCLVNVLSSFLGQLLHAVTNSQLKEMRLQTPLKLLVSFFFVGHRCTAGKYWNYWNWTCLSKSASTEEFECLFPADYFIDIVLLQHLHKITHTQICYLIKKEEKWRISSWLLVQ